MIGGRKVRSNKGSKRVAYKMSGKPRKARSNKGSKRSAYKMSNKPRKTRSNKGSKRGPRSAAAKKAAPLRRSKRVASRK
mgnify:CR=1 FL=1